MSRYRLPFHALVSARLKQVRKEVLGGKSSISNNNPPKAVMYDVQMVAGEPPADRRFIADDFTHVGRPHDATHPSFLALGNQHRPTHRNHLDWR
jgi:hypothetical protein